MTLHKMQQPGLGADTPSGFRGGFSLAWRLRVAMEFSGLVSWVRNILTKAVQTKGDRWSGCTDGGQRT